MQTKRSVSRDWELTRAGLFQPETRLRVKEEIEEDQAALYASFWEGREPAQTLRLFKHLRRYLFNTLALASFHGILQGQEVFQLGQRLGSSKATLYIARLIKKQPDASDKQICDYLDKCNLRLLALNSTNFGGTQWAGLPAKWGQVMEEKLKDVKIRKKFREVFEGSSRREGREWNESLHLIPGRVMTFLSRARKNAKDPHLRNALFVWPKIAREYKKVEHKPKC